MTSPARFSKGVTNVTSSNTFGQLICPDPTLVTVFWDDFIKFVPSDWFITRVGTGATAGAETVSDATGGILAFYPKNGDDDSTFFEYKGYDNVTSASEVFAFVASKKLWFKARFKVSDTGDSDFFVGLKSADTTPLTSPADGVWFQSDDGDDYLDLHVYASSAVVLSDTAIHTCVDDTYLTCGFYYDGSKLWYYVNDINVGSSAGISVPTNELTVSFGVRNGSAAARTMSVDYICAIKER